MSPIGSPLPESPGAKAAFYENVKHYHLFGQKSPEIANMIGVVTQPPGMSHSWENPMIPSTSSEEYNLSFGNIIPPISGQTADDDAPDEHINMTYNNLGFKGNLSMSNMDIWQSPNTPPLTPPLRPSPPILSPLLKNRKSNLEQGWVSDPLIPHLPITDQLNNEEIIDYKGIKTIWDAEKVITSPNFIYHREDFPNHAEYLLNRGRSYSRDPLGSRSSSGSVSPKYPDEDNHVFNRSHPPPNITQPSQIPIRLSETPPASPITIPRKTSRLPTLVSQLNRARLSSPHPVSRTGGVYPRPQPQPQPQPLQQPQLYPIWTNDLPAEYTSSSPALHLLPHPIPYSFTRPIHFVTEEDFADGKIRSRSLGDGKGDKPGQRLRHKKMTRPRKNSTSIEDLTRFELDVNRVRSGQDTRTTLMIKNIPNKYDQEMLLEAINFNFKGTYDFFYLPIDFKNKCNVGYAFINFINYETVALFYLEFNHKKWEKFNSEKVCKITFARIQGKSAFIDHFRNSSLMYEDQACRPLIFHSSGPSIGQLENFPPANISRSRSGSTEQAPVTEEPNPPSPSNQVTAANPAINSNSPSDEVTPAASVIPADTNTNE
jgi:hypothetical protein